jgi:hypothetical protein
MSFKFELSAARRPSAAASLDMSAFVWRSWHGVHKVRKLEMLAWPPAGSVRRDGHRCCCCCCCCCCCTSLYHRSNVISLHKRS